MEIPITVFRPTLVFQPLDEAGDPTGSPVDVSCDIVSAELAPDVPINSVSTFCGTAQVVGEVEVSLTLEVAINLTTNSRWASLVGDSVEVQIKDRTADSSYRAFPSIVPLNPALYGPDTPGEARQFSFDMPVMGEVAIVTPS